MRNPSSLCACSGNVTVARRVAVLWRGRGAMADVRGGAQLARVYPVPSWALLQIFMLYISFGTLFEFICCLPLSMCCCDFVCECEWLLLLQGRSGRWVLGVLLLFGVCGWILPDVLIRITDADWVKELTPERELWFGRTICHRQSDLFYLLSLCFGEPRL